MKRVFACVLALFITVVLAALYPLLEEGADMLEEGKTVVVWMQGVESDGAAFLKKAALAYEKETQNRVYLRACSQEETKKVLAGEETVVPDMMVMQEGDVPLFYRGYVLTVPDAERVLSTLPPTPSLFQRPTSTPSLSTPLPRPFPDALEKVAVPPGFLGIVEGSYVSENPLDDLKNQKAKAALLTPTQVQQLQGGYQFHAREDFFLPVEGRALTQTGADFMFFLFSDAVQLLLKEQKLFAADGTLSLYSPDVPLLYQMENSRKNMEK